MTTARKDIRYALGSLCLLLMLALLPGVCAAAAAEPGTSRGETTMNRTNDALQNRQRFLGDRPAPLAETDPEFAALRDRLLYGEIVARGVLDQRQQMLVALVSLVAVDAQDSLEEQAEAALRLGILPQEIREAIYQCAPYVGIPRTEAALRRINAVFSRAGIARPLPEQGTVTEEDRFRAGCAVQKRIFGDTAIDSMHAAAPDGQKDIMVNYLSAYCFGDIYTRKGLDLKLRELLTFAMVSSLGGCEAQVKAHVRGCANMGNSKQELVDALARILPYIGFPRTLNALGCVNEVLPQ